MKMDRKVIISLVGLIIAFVLFAIIWKIVGNKTETKNENITKISLVESVTDECTEEWEEYNDELQTAFEQTSNNITDIDNQYLLKSENGYILIYYIDENNEEVLYRKTSISVDYLSENDKENLEKGIKVVGITELNKILEDFE